MRNLLVYRTEIPLTAVVFELLAERFAESTAPRQLQPYAVDYTARVGVEHQHNLVSLVVVPGEPDRHVQQLDISYVGLCGEPLYHVILRVGLL